MARVQAVVCLVGTMRRRFEAGDTYASSDYQPRAPAKDGAQRRPPPLVGPALRIAGNVPGLRGFTDDVRPMPVEVLCRAIARILRDRAPAASVMTGRQLWQAAAL